MEEDKKQSIYMGGAAAYGLVVLYVLHYMQVSTNGGGEFLDYVLGAFEHMFQHPFSIGQAFLHPFGTIKVLLIATVVFAMVFLYVVSEMESMAHADEKTALGSAGWNTKFKEFRESYTIPRTPGTPDKNIILAKDVKYGLRKGDNTNVTIIGSAGTGKSFGVIKPNLMQMNSSYVVTDPSGEIFRAEAVMLMRNGYEVKVFSTSQLTHSHVFNPFDSVYNEEGEVDETRVTSMISMFLDNAANMGDVKAKSGDKFWDQAAKALLIACAMLLLEFYPEEKHNFYEMLRLIQKGKQDENDRNSNGETELGRIFEAARKINPEAHCFSSYDTFKLAPARTANSILISAGVDLNIFDQDPVRNLTTTAYKVKARNVDGTIRSLSRDANGKLIRTDDNLDLRTVGDKKSCVFINIPQADATFNFLVSMMYSQMFEALYGRAEKICPTKYMVLNHIGEPILSMIDSEDDAIKLIHYYQNARIEKSSEDGKDTFFIVSDEAEKRFWIPGMGGGKLQRVYSEETGKKYLKQFEKCTVKRGEGCLPWHVQMLLDEFANIGSIPAFPQKLATSRKYEISCMIVLQSISQLKNRYDTLWEDILSNCNMTIFLGSPDPGTDEYVSKRLGFVTIKVKSHGKSGKSNSQNIGLQKRELLTTDEVGRIDKKKCIVFVTSEKPFYVPKFKASDHENWKYTGDVDKTARLESAEFIVTKEKKFSKDGEARAMAEVMKGALNNVLPDGRRAIQKPRPVSNPEEMMQSAENKDPSSIQPAPAEDAPGGQNMMVDMDDLGEGIATMIPVDRSSESGEKKEYRQGSRTKRPASGRRPNSATGAVKKRRTTETEAEE